MKLRLLVTEKCNRRCKGCCNKTWDLKHLPVCENFAGFEEILLTGGEPMLYPTKLERLIEHIRTATISPIYLYTAKINNWNAVHRILAVIDGLTLTLHQKADLAAFFRLNMEFQFEHAFRNKSLRLNIFREVGPFFIPSIWKAKGPLEWIPNCPLPEGEVFMRLPECFS